ncbi:hypothetical protein LRS06_21305 [Hymenobacter sp. J193]|uniref:hypothetical protein n=1 Tax=Hymenobacter sp. J193 TaxID=2898429 RepID=UPI002150CAFD|nr:hypothetical protein [Hymenobacter sp. J193]MCR5890267.1 hypothetical protein [Hymenobacter sp. J193]
MPALAMQCRPDVSVEQQGGAQAAADTVDVTSFNIERENNSPELANWAVFEVGQEIICTPPGWKAHQTDDELILLPPTRTDSTERVTFARFNKDSPSLDYNSFARQMAKTAFDDFTIQKGDTLNQLIFQRDFGYERNTGLLLAGTTYKGYCMVYVNDRFVYKYRIILAENRLKNYRGDLFQDIIGNLQVNKQYLVGNDNPIKQIIHVN